MRFAYPPCETVWLLARGLKRSLWAAFGIGWVMYWSGGRLPFWL